MIGSSRGTRFPGRDRRAVRHQAASGRVRVDPAAPRRVAVLGGGIAGVSAAVALAERGVEVVLLEGEAQLGGRLRGWPTTLADGSEVTMTRGFHAFFRQYYTLRSLLARVDTDLVPLLDYPLIDAEGRRDTFSNLPRTPPWNAAAFALSSPTFSVREMRYLDGVAALPLVDVSVPGVYDRLDDRDAWSFLEAVRFPDAAKHLAFSVFSRSFFADPRTLSAAELATMFHIYFLGSSEGLVFDVAAEPFPQAVWDPLHTYLHSLGVDVRMSTRGARVSNADARMLAADAGTTVDYRVETDTGATLDVDAVVLAMDTDGLRAVVAASPDLGDDAWRSRIDGLRTAPPFLVSRFWLDRAVRADRPGFLGTAGYGPVDNVSVLERYEGEAKRWADRTGGSVVEVHAYALQPDLADDQQAARDRLLAELYRVYPETAAATIVDERHELRADCPLFAPGTFRARPTTTTPSPGVVVAGDLTRVDLPVALMERASISGFLAANALLDGWGVRGHDLWSVPTEGRFAPLRALAARFA